MAIHTYLRTGLLLLTTVLLLLAAGALTAASASARSTAPAEFSFTFDHAQPGTPANAELYILYKDPQNPEDPDGRSPALTEVIIAAPPGTVFDGSAVPACPASDAELMALGTLACPEESKVGGGFGSVVTTTGPPNEFVAEVTLFNYGDGVIELLEFAEGGLKIVDRARFEGPNTMVLNPAVVPGFTEREFSLSYDGTRGGPNRAFITTPPQCPSSGLWTSQLMYTVTTGATYRVKSAMPCGAAATSQPGTVASPPPGVAKRQSAGKKRAGKKRKRNRCKRRKARKKAGSSKRRCGPRR